MRSLLAPFMPSGATLSADGDQPARYLLFASLLYAIEHRVQPDKFGTIPQAHVVGDRDARTVGYGDVVPG